MLTPDMKNLASGSGASSENSDSPSSEKLMDSFGKTFKQKLGQLESLQQDAQIKMQKFAAGEIEDVHDVSVSLQKANMGLNMATAVRQKVLEGIQELQQMG
jgi:flagellar hook-basal body complex protein FliE